MCFAVGFSDAYDNKQVHRVFNFMSNLKPSKLEYLIECCYKHLRGICQEKKRHEITYKTLQNNLCYVLRYDYILLRAD